VEYGHYNSWMHKPHHTTGMDIGQEIQGVSITGHWPLFIKRTPNVLQNNKGTCLKYGGIFCDGLITSLLQNQTVCIWQSYGEEYTDTF